MKSIKVCEYSRSKSFHDDLILQDQASGEHSQDQWSSGSIIFAARGPMQIKGGQSVDDFIREGNCKYAWLISRLVLWIDVVHRQIYWSVLL